MTDTPISMRWEYRDDKSKKAYELYLLQRDGGWVVDFGYGRIGGDLKLGTKTKAALAYPVAFQVLGDEVKERMGKQYTQVSGQVLIFHNGVAVGVTGYDQGVTVKDGVLVPAPGPVAPVGDNSKVDTGFRPQLLNEIAMSARKRGESLFEYYLRQAYTFLYSADWHAQRKHNGVRLILIWDKGEVTGANRKGESRAVPPNVAATFAKAMTKRKLARTVVDGELVGETYWVFDLLVYDGNDWSHRVFSDRVMHLAKLNDGSPDVRMVDVAETPPQKILMLRDLLTEYRKGGKTYCAAEGMVFKKRGATVKTGRPNSGGDQMKLKFWRDVDVIIIKQNGNKRSVAMGLLDNGVMVEMGNITIPANYDIPTPGQVAKVRFLTCLEGGSLVQPQYEGTRDDKNAKECTLSQIVFYPESLGETE